MSPATYASFARGSLMRSTSDASVSYTNSPYAVLGRELLVAPVDLAAIVARIVAEHPDMQPLRVRVSPCDAQAVDALALAALPATIADAALAPGDAIVELTGTSIDARLGIRLCVLLNAAS